MSVDATAMTPDKLLENAAGNSRSVVHEQFPAAATIVVPCDTANCSASNNDSLHCGDPRLRLITSTLPSDGSAAHRIPDVTFAIEPLPPLSTRTGTIVTFGAPPMPPIALSRAPTMPATCVPCDPLSVRSSPGTDEVRKSAPGATPPPLSVRPRSGWSACTPESTIPTRTPAPCASPPPQAVSYRTLSMCHCGPKLDDGGPRYTGSSIATSCTAVSTSKLITGPLVCAIASSWADLSAAEVTVNECATGRPDVPSVTAT